MAAKTRGAPLAPDTTIASLVASGDVDCNEGVARYCDAYKIDTVAQLAEHAYYDFFTEPDLLTVAQIKGAERLLRRAGLKFAAVPWCVRHAPPLPTTKESP